MGFFYSKFLFGFISIKYLQVFEIICLGLSKAGSVMLHLLFFNEYPKVLGQIYFNFNGIQMLNVLSYLESVKVIYRACSC